MFFTHAWNRKLYLALDITYYSYQEVLIILSSRGSGVRRHPDQVATCLRTTGLTRSSRAAASCGRYGGDARYHLESALRSRRRQHNRVEASGFAQKVLKSRVRLLVKKTFLAQRRKENPLKRCSFGCGCIS
jgi:hypothetical protein